MIAVLDSGPLYAAIDRSDRDHQRCVTALHTPGLRRFVPALVVAEVTHLIGKRLGSSVEAGFLAGLVDVDVQAPATEDWKRISQLVEQYADFPLDGTDASVIALAERLNTSIVITLDRRHFSTVRPRHCSAFQLLPE